MKQLQKLGIVLISGIMLLGCQEAGTNAKNKQKVLDQPLAMQSESNSKQFPDFVVKDFEGGEKALKDDLTTIILDLFATWCPPCRMEIPHFVELQNTYQAELAIIGLSYDKTSVEKVKAFAEEMKINYDLFWGSEEIAKHVGLRGIPHTLVIDQQGRVVQSYVGYRDKAVFEKDIIALKEKAATTESTK